jgi:hypothetical protein
LEEFRAPGTRLRFDIVNVTKRVAVEINGKQHESYNSYFHRGSRINFLNQIKRDQTKRDWCELNGFVMVEILPEDLPLSEKFFAERYGLELV